MVGNPELRGKRDLWMRALMLLLVFVLCGPSGILTAQQPPRTAAQEGFVPVDRLPTDESVPAAPLLIAAYAVAWLAIAGYLWSIWQRLGRVERELIDVRRRVEAGARR
jgi:CcmD family protein